MHHLNNIRTKRGFTLIEMLLSVALIAAIAGIGIPVYQSFQVKNDLDIAANTVAQTLHRAQILSEANDGDSNWGVKIASGSITLFKGAAFAGRDANYDETYVVPTSISIDPSGLDEIFFTKLTGLPQSAGTIKLTAATAEEKIITINSKGVVSH